MEEKEMLIQIMQTLNTFQAETVKAINDLREEVRENKREIQKSREIENQHWQENLRRWEENDKRWKENDRRWEENKASWNEYRKNREQDRKDILNILTSYDLTISEKLGDANVPKMKKIIGQV